MPQSVLIPRRPVPDLDVVTVDQGRWRLADRTPEHFSMIVFYRGLHCPICSKSLADLERRHDDFSGLGVDVIAVSCDPEERARQAASDWGLKRVTLGYGVNIDTARNWGLFISSGVGKTSVGIEEPAQFSEPGLFLIRTDGTLYCSTVQTMPFARPHFAEVVGAIDFAISKNYPARGELAP